MGKRGFTILEVLIASILVGGSMFAITEAFNRGVFGLGEVEDYSLALTLTQEKLEEIKNSSFDSVSSETKGTVSGFSDFNREVNITNVDSDLKQVVVITYWNVPNGEKNVNLTTYIARS